MKSYNSTSLEKGAPFLLLPGRRRTFFGQEWGGGPGGAGKSEFSSTPKAGSAGVIGEPLWDDNKMPAKNVHIRFSKVTP